MAKYGISTRDAELTALVMALEFYADAEQYEVIAEPQTKPMILADHGRTARHALSNAGKRGQNLHQQFVSMGERINHQKHKLTEQARIIAELKGTPPANREARL